MKKLRTTSGIMAGFAAGCCFGLLNVLFGALGFTATVAAINKYGDFIFFPLYAFFATLFVLSLKRSWLKKTVAVIAAGLGIYFMIFGVLYASLIVGGALLGGLAFKWLKK